MTDKQKHIIDLLFALASDKQNNEYCIEDLCVVNSLLANLVQDACNFNIANFAISVDVYGFKHTIDKHGNVIRENLRGQSAVTQEDFDKIIEIVQEPDRVLPHTFKMASSGRDAFIVVKQYDTLLFYVVFEIRCITGKKKQLYKKNRIVLQTMYKKTSCT